MLKFQSKKKFLIKIALYFTMKTTNDSFLPKNFFDLKSVVFDQNGDCIVYTQRKMLIW